MAEINIDEHTVKNTDYQTTGDKDAAWFVGGDKPKEAPENGMKSSAPNAETNAGSRTEITRDFQTSADRDLGHGTGKTVWTETAPSSAPVSPNKAPVQGK